MNKLNRLLLASTAIAAAGPALAASSGNFTGTVDNGNCTINSANGQFTGNGSSAVAAGTIFDIFSDTLKIQIANGSGTAMVVTPSLVTGLFTDNKITSTNQTSTEDVGIQIQVLVTPTNGTVVPAGAIKISPLTPGDSMNNTDKGATCMVPAGSPIGSVVSCVIYDQRFIQVSSSVFQNIAGCTTNLLGAPATCFELIESTLSAHAFNFYVQAPGGSYNFDVDAQLFVGKNNTSGSIAGCAGPGTVTVVQVKNFSFDTPISF